MEYASVSNERGEQSSPTRGDQYQEPVTKWVHITLARHSKRLEQGGIMSTRRGGDTCYEVQGSSR